MSAETMVSEKRDSSTAAARLLVVEDERIIARSLCKQLAALGYNVIASVATGAKAIEAAGDFRPDLTLMDISLDGPMDGVEAAAIIRRRFRIPVVYLTAYSNREILERAKVTEPFGYILKPYEDRNLHVVVETALYKHRMEQRQQQRERWFAATLKSIGDAVVASDEEDFITYMNPVAESLTGWTSEHALGRRVGDVVRLVDCVTRQPVGSPLDHAVREGKPSDGILLIAKDRTERTVEYSDSLIEDEQAAALGSVMVFRDVSWRKRLEEQSQQAKKLQAIGQLAGGVAHSFNNLMTTVLGYSSIMLDAMKPGNPFYDGVVEIDRAATRSAKLTAKLLAFGRKQILTLLPLDINAVVQELAVVLRNLQDGVFVYLDLDPKLARTWGDLGMLEETIITLVRNACESMPGGGQVTIQTTNVVLGPDDTRGHAEVQPGSYVRLAISDTGVGMTPQSIGRLFEPFHTKDAKLGAGLGLAAVYGFIMQCGGDIDVQSQPGKGTTFNLFLPAEPSAPPGN